MCRAFRRGLGFASVGLGLAGVSGCTNSAPVNAPIQFETGFDVTQKGIKKRIEQASPLADFVKKGDVFTLRAIDNKTSLIATTCPASADDVYRLLTDTSGKIIPRTDLARYFETIADVAERGELPLVAVLYTDGLQDVGDPETVAVRVRAAAHRLARAKRLRALVLVGTVRDVRPNWEDLPEMLAPVRSKLSVLPMTTLDPDDVHRLVRQARTAVPMQKGAQ